MSPFALRRDYIQRLLRLLFGVAFCALTATAYGQPTAPQLLAPGQSVEREMAVGGEHFYSFTLAAGECARIELQSGKARLGLALLSDKQEMLVTIADADAPRMKRLDVTTEQDARFTIRVAPDNDLPAAVKYQLQFKEKHAATAEDRERFALHKLDWEIVRLYREQEKSALRQAVAKGREVAARWLALGELERAGSTLNRVGRSAFLLSEHQIGREVFLQAASLFQKAGARREESVSIATQGLLELADGEYQKSFSLAVRTLAIWNSIKDEDALRNARLLQAMHYRNIGEWRQAETQCRQLLPETYTGRIDEWDKVYRDDVLMVLGLALAGQGRWQEGISTLEEALSIARRSHNSLNVVQILVQLGTAHRLAGQTAKAIESFEQCVIVSRRLGIRSYESQALSELGNLYLAAGRRAEARATLAQAIESGVIGGKVYLSNALFSLAQLQHDEGQFAEALTGVEQAVKITEGLRVQLPMQDTARVTTAILERNAYALRLDLLLHLHERNPQAGHDVAALQASELAHARSLVQMLSEQKQKSLGTEDAALSDRLKNLRQRISALTNEQLRLRTTAGPVRSLESVQQELSSALAELDRVVLEMRDRNPRGAALTLPAPLTMTELQKNIVDADTALLEYALGDERSFLFVVTADALRVFNLPGRHVIEPLAREVYAAVSRAGQPKTYKNVAEKGLWLEKNERNYWQFATQLSQLVLQPALPLLGNKRLIVVPDGALHYVPFAALPDLRTATAAKQTGNKSKSGAAKQSAKALPLIVNHEILNMPSALTLATLRRENAKREAAPKTLAVVADPVFQVSDMAVESNATAGKAKLTERTRSFFEVDKNGQNLIPRLPASRKEAEAILSLVPTQESSVALDYDASYERVTRGDLGNYRYVHFATHGLLDEVQPELSGLLLAQVNRQGASTEGYFTTLDAFNLNLNAELVVLSGCRTAIGKEVKGEGLQGLTRGFMYAGARRVLASLWQISDDATAELMRRFYQAMLGEQKLSPAKALRLSKLNLLKDSPLQSPYYWAAFTLQGEW